MGYEEGKCHSNVGPSMQERRIINTRAVMNAIDTQERK